MSRLKNTLHMLDVLSTRHVVPIKTLSEMFDVTERTIQRMRDDLIDLGYDIKTHHGPGGGYQLMNSSQIHPLSFTYEEIRSIRQSVSYLLAVDENHIDTHTKKALSKLVHQFDPTANARALQAFKTVNLNVDKQVYSKTITALENAIKTQERIVIVYQKNKREQRIYHFEPYELILVDSLWYINGYEKQGRQLSLKVIRILEIKATYQKFKKDKFYTSKQYFSDYGFRINPVNLKVKINNMDTLTEYIWGENQVITWINDYEYILSARFPNDFAAKEFILSSGSRLEVLEPEYLRTWIIEEARKIHDMYR